MILSRVAFYFSMADTIFCVTNIYDAACFFRIFIIIVINIILYHYCQLIANGLQRNIPNKRTYFSLQSSQVGNYGRITIYEYYIN